VVGESETLAVVPDGRLGSIGPGSWAQSRSLVSELSCEAACCFIWATWAAN
jgi:hypothetical protein